MLTAGGAAFTASIIGLPPGDVARAPDWAPAAGLEFTTVGHAGNAADVTGFGTVAYEYRIGSTEVTNLHYARFLNAVAASDPYGLYDPRMAWTATEQTGIVRTGTPGSYAYLVHWTSSSIPATYVDWFSAARFANWLHNGALPGGETEAGAYALAGATSGRVPRSAAARVWIPTENEWYKAAYYSPTYREPTLAGGDRGGYWRYPTQAHDVTPQTAVYSTPERPAVPQGGLVTGRGTSAFGTFNQGGNVWEYLDADPGSTRWLRGGGAGSGQEALASYTDPTTFQYAFGSFGTAPPALRESDVGFRLAAAPVDPEPLALDLSATTITENNAVGAVVGRFTSGPPGPGGDPQYVIFSATGGLGDPGFEIVADELRARAVFDYEQQQDYSFWVAATVPGREPVVRKFSILVADAVDPITDLALWPGSQLAWSLPRIGVLRAMPVDAAATRSFTLLREPGTDGALFAINGDVLHVVSTSFRPDATYRIRVRAEDGLGRPFDADLVVAGEASGPLPPMRGLDLGDLIAGRDGFGGPVTGLVGVDGIHPASGAFTSGPIDEPLSPAGYQPVAGPLIDGVFVVNGSERTTFTSAGAEFRPYEYAVTATSFDAITHDRTPGGTAPLALDGIRYRSGVAVRGSAGVTFDLREIALRHGGLPSRFTARFGTPEGHAAVTGYVLLGDEQGLEVGRTVARAAAEAVNLDVTLPPEARFLALVALGDTSPPPAAVFAAATLDLRDGPAAPVEVRLSGMTVAERSPAYTVVGTLSSVDVNAGDAFTYELVAGYGDGGNANFRVVGHELQTARVLGREALGSQWVRVRSTDAAGLATERAFAITVTDVPEPPTDIVLSPASIAENRPANTVVGSLLTIDPDAGDTHGYELVAGPGSDDNGRFLIVGQTIRTAAPLDFETQARHSLRVRSTDAGGMFVERVLVVTVADVAEAATVVRVVPPANGVYGPGRLLAVTLVTTQAVSLAGPGRPEIPFTIGGRKAALVYRNSGPGNRLTFTYTVQPRDAAPAGIRVEPVLRLPAGTVFRTAAGRTLPTTLPRIDGSSLRIDTAVPEVAELTGPPSGSYGAGATLAFVVRFTEAVAVSGVPALPVTIGAKVRQARYVSGGGTTRLLFRYTVQPADLAPSGITTGKAFVMVAGAAIRDAAGNRAAASVRQQAFAAVRVGVSARPD